MLEKTHYHGTPLLVARDVRGLDGITVAFSARPGGVSTGEYRGLNVSYNVGDEAGRVGANRKLLAEALGVDVDGWVLGRQVHGSTVAHVGPMERGRGGRDHWSGLPRCDGLVTSTPGIALGVLTADCLPLLLVSPGTRSVAAIHAGWRGTLAGIGARGLAGLARWSGAEPADVLAFIGPHIMACCLVVRLDVAEAFRRKFGDEVVDSDGGGAFRLDLAKACAKQLESEGADPAKIYYSDECTCCGRDYFSYRASGGITGRQAAIVYMD